MKANQKGFSVVELLIIIVVVGLLGAVGWLVYDRQNNKNTSTTQSEQSSSTTQANKEANTNKYLTIKEWGVQFSVPNDIQDLTYENYQSYDGGEVVRLTSPSLEAEGKLKSGGPETREKIGLLYRAKTGTKSGLDGCDTNEYCATQNSWSHKTVGDYFYYYDPSHSPADFFNSSYRKSVDDSVMTLSPTN